MADDSEPDDSSTAHDEEGPEQPTGTEPEASDDQPSSEDGSGEDVDGSDNQANGREGSGDDGPTGGLSRVDDGDQPNRETPVDRPEEPPANRTRTGHPDAHQLPPDDDRGPQTPPGIPDGPRDFIGPLPPEEAEDRNGDTAEYGPEPIPELEEDLDDLGPDEDLMEQYEKQGELIEESTGQELLEPEAEAAVDESDTGGLLDRDGEGPPDDQEMPLTEHVEEMVRRLGIVVIAAAVITILAWPFSEGATLHIWTAVLPTADAPDPHLYGPLEKVLTQIKVAGLAGILIALPLIVYQTYRFMRPGLYPHERRYYLAAVPTSLVLAAAGMAFSYFLVLPTLFVYFMYYTEGSVDLVAFGLAKTFNLIVTLTGVLAVVFQIPLFIMLAIMMGVTSRHWLADKRIYFWAAFAGGSFLIAPDPTGMAPFLVAGTAIGLFEGTLFLLKWVKRGRRRYRSGREEGA